jgi:type III secretion system HrpE/YscL family protein
MTFAMLHHGPSGVLAFHGARIAHSAFKELVASDELLSHAKAAAQVIMDDVEAESAKQFETAREAGFEQGRAEGVVAVMATMEVERRMRELLTTQIASLVEQCVRNILSELGPEEVFRRRVQRLIRGSATVGGSKLHVNPGQAHVVHAMLAKHTQDDGGDLSWLTVISDETCSRDTLVLETQVGFIDASLDITLASFGDILGRAVERAAALLQR